MPNSPQRHPDAHLVTTSISTSISHQRNKAELPSSVVSALFISSPAFCIAPHQNAPLHQISPLNLSLPLTPPPSVLRHQRQYYLPARSHPPPLLAPLTSLSGFRPNVMRFGKRTGEDVLVRLGLGIGVDWVKKYPRPRRKRTIIPHYRALLRPCGRCAEEKSGGSRAMQGP